MVQLISIKNTLTSIQNIFSKATITLICDSDGAAAAGLLNNTFSHTGRKPQYVSLAGTDDNAPTDGELQTAFLKFANDEEFDVSLIPVVLQSSVQ